MILFLVVVSEVKAVVDDRVDASNITADVATTRMDGRHLFWHCFVEREIFIMDGNRL